MIQEGHPQTKIDELKKHYREEQTERQNQEAFDMDEKHTVFFTIGYGALNNVAELVQIMKSRKISILLDVRSKPVTRRFSKKTLEKMVEFAYISRPEMGGFDHEINQFEAWLVQAQQGINQLSEMGTKGEKVMILCAEKNPDKCHRKYFVARALEENGYTVKHL